jgi:hypothetical protein
VARRDFQVSPASPAAGPRTCEVRITPGRSVIKAKSEQKHVHLRCVAPLASASCEILDSMGSSSPTSDAELDASATPPDGISSFVARVLDQLRISAWLPAAFLVACTAVLLQFRSARSADLLSAIKMLTADPVQVLVITIPLLVVAALVTQAFSFEAIRATEGYWRGLGPVSVFDKLMIRRHVRRKTSLLERRYRESRKAVRAAIPDMVMTGVPVPVLRALEMSLSGQGGLQLTSEERQILGETNWRQYCEAWRLARIDHLEREWESYPATHRVMPTKLGNVLRATEDRLTHAGADLQGFVMRRRDMVSRRVRMQHDDFRNRLEMYCTLVFVSVFLAVLAPAELIGRAGALPTVVISVTFATVSKASYMAAIASARGYCATLRQMDKAAAE